METDAVLKALAALAQENRLAIFRLLIQHAPHGLSAGVIGEKLALANATLSFHLKELAHSGLLTARSQSRFIYYAPNLEVMTDLMAYLTDNCCVGSGMSCDVNRAPICAPMRTKRPPRRKS
jgi:ArsR family transcriptional regulator